MHLEVKKRKTVLFSFSSLAVGRKVIHSFTEITFIDNMSGRHQRNLSGLTLHSWTSRKSPVSKMGNRFPFDLIAIEMKKLPSQLDRKKKNQLKRMALCFFHKYIFLFIFFSLSEGVLQNLHNTHRHTDTDSHIQSHSFLIQ